MYKLIESLIELMLGVWAFVSGVGIIGENREFNLLCGTVEPDLAPPAPPAQWLGVVLILLGIGLVALAVRNAIVGAKRLMTDVKTQVHGVERIGVVAEVKSAWGDANGNPFQTVHVGVLQPDNSIVHFHAPLRIGEQYDIGDFVYVKQHEKDINVLRLVESTELPIDTARLLKYYPKFWSVGYVGEYFISGHAIEDISTMQINDKRYNTQFDYDKAIDSGFYEGDSGMYYKDDTKTEE